jgi:dipeptidyl aminopeptidase/acylaminoacyl peptidase
MAKRKIEVKDLFGLSIVSDPQISPDGGRVAFVHTRMDYEKDEYVNDIWMADVEGGKPYQFTSGRGKDKHPRWSPDGSQLMFVSAPLTKEGEEKKKPQLYVMPVGGGEARMVTDVEGGVQSPKWSPDGRQLLYISPVEAEKQEGDVKVIKRIAYKFNGVGFFQGKRKHLFTVRAGGGKPKQVTKGEFDVNSAEWLGRNDVVFVSNLEEDADITRESHIYRVSAKGGEPERLTEGRWSISSAKPSPKGDVIAFTGHDFNYEGATMGDVYTLPAGGGKPVNLTASFDQDLGTKLSSDVRVSSPEASPEWSKDGGHIYFTSNYGGVAKIYRVPASGGEVAEVAGGVNHSVEAWTRAEEGTIAYTTLGTTSPIELWAMTEKGSKQLTNLNKKWVNSLDIRDHERFEFKSSAGHTVEGWLMKPPGFRKNGKYPMVVEIHGGPRGVYGYSLMHEFQVLAAQGWVVMYINPYGSGGYYQEFQAGLPQHYGEQDYADIMEAVDHVLEANDFIDLERLGVTGGSYGGYMTNWIVTQTDRFKAAVTQRSISNWMSFFGCSDIGWTFGMREMGGVPWEDEEKFLAKSPIRYVKNVKTPTLIIHSEEDHRCPMEQGEQFYAALKYLGVPTEFVRFPGESHELSRGGKPKHREQRLNHIVRWFKEYLK